VDSADFGRRVADVVRAADAVDRVCLAGFGVESARGARQALPGAAASASHPEVRWALYRSWVGWPVRPVAYGGYQVPEHAGLRRVVSPRFIRHAHAAGLAVEVWTVDDADDMRRLLSSGCRRHQQPADVAVTVRDRFWRAVDVRSNGSPLRAVRIWGMISDAATCSPSFPRRTTECAEC
jgi:glycerophosphoryl diester phosphodiesterase